MLEIRRLRLCRPRGWNPRSGYSIRAHVAPGRASFSLHTRSVRPRRKSRKPLRDEFVGSAAYAVPLAKGFLKVTTFPGTPPGPAAGDTSPTTIALRPSIGLTKDRLAAVRRRVRARQSFSTIASTLGMPVDLVERAALAMRTRRPSPTRGTLNVTREALAFVVSETSPRQAQWQTVDRLMGELMSLRDEVGRLRARDARNAAIILGLRALVQTQADEIARLRAAS